MSSPRHSRAERSTSSTSGDHAEQSTKRERPGDGPVKKSARACLNCRKQKMKCDLEGDPPCKRCAKSNTPCLFKVRANGVEAGDWYISDQNVPADEDFKQDILTRLHKIEAKLGITRSRSSWAAPASEAERPEVQAPATPEPEKALPDLWTALGVLIGRCSDADKMHQGWNTLTVEALWLSFAEHMPALHFSTQQIFNDRPTPLLLASVLFAASIRHPLGEYAQLSPFYHSAAALAIAHLAVPASDNVVFSDAQDLQDALGIIVLGLLSEAWVDQTGIWISMANALILNGACKCDRAKLHEWRSIYEGLRVVDIEHASLRMTYPVLPLLCPFATLESITPESDNPRQAWTHLTTIMHVGLSHFAGRGTTTIMDTVLKDVAHQRPPAASPDPRSIKGWANELDAWLVKYHKPSKSQQRGTSEANIILLQYQLHKLFVLFIHHSVTPEISIEDLLTAARAALRIQRLGMTVWSNWDLVLITLAALVALSHCKLLEQQEDRMLVQGHINALRATSQPQPNLRSTLATRLEGRLQSALATATVDPQSINFGDLRHGPTSTAHQPFSTDALFGLSDLESWWTNEMNNILDVTALEPGGNQSELGLGNWPPSFQRIMDSLLDSGDTAP